MTKWLHAWKFLWFNYFPLAKCMSYIMQWGHTNFYCYVHDLHNAIWGRTNFPYYVNDLHNAIWGHTNFPCYVHDFHNAMSTLISLFTTYGLLSWNIVHSIIDVDGVEGYRAEKSYFASHACKSYQHSIFSELNYSFHSLSFQHNS